MSTSQAQANATRPASGADHARGDDAVNLASEYGAPGPVGEQGQSDLSRILKLSVPVMVVLAEQEMAIKSILEMTVGTIVEFDVPFDAELELRVANQTIGRGNAIKIGENFGLSITAVDSVSQRVDALGGS